MKKTIKNFWGFEYITVKDVPVEKTPHGEGISAEVLGKLEKAIALQIVTRRVPIRGKELTFVRKAFGLSARALAEMLSISHVALLKWERAEKTRLDHINEIAVRAVLAKFMHLDLHVQDAILSEAQKPDKIEVRAG